MQKTPAPISMQNWQQLQSVLRDAPSELQSAIKQAGEARVDHADQTELPNHSEPQEPKTILFDILTKNINPALLADTEFEKLHNAVNGENLQLQQAYAVALTGYCRTRRLLFLQHQAIL